MASSDNVSGKDDSLEKMVEYALLYDFYGALLKDKNRSIFEDYMFNDMTLSEIAAEREITRQGVRDIVNRAKASLTEYEERLGLVRRFDKVMNSAHVIKEDLLDIRKCVDTLCGAYAVGSGIKERIDKHIADIDNITDDILEEF